MRITPEEFLKSKHPGEGLVLLDNKAVLKLLKEYDKTLNEVRVVDLVDVGIQFTSIQSEEVMDTLVAAAKDPKVEDYKLRWLFNRAYFIGVQNVVSEVRRVWTR